MKRLLVLMIIAPVAALAVTSPPPTHIWAEDTSAGSIPDVPATREWTIVRIDSMASYIRYLFEHQQALVLPMGDMYYLYWAYNDNNSHVRTKVFLENQIDDPGSWIAQDIYEWTGDGSLRYVSPSAYFDGSFWYREVTFNAAPPLTCWHVVNEGFGPGGIWSNPYDLLISCDLPITWAGPDNVVYMLGTNTSSGGYLFIAFNGWGGSGFNESPILPTVYSQGYENSQLVYHEGTNKIVVAAGGYRTEDFAAHDNPLLVVFQESTDGGDTWSDEVWLDQEIVPDIPGGLPGIQGHYSNSFFDMLLDEDGDLHFAAVLVDSGYSENESDVLGIYDIHQNDGTWTASLINDGIYGDFNPRELYLEGDSWMHSPSLSLAPDGRIVACWNDIGWNDPVDSLVSIDIWLSGSTDGGETWIEPRLITETSDVDEYFSRLTTYCTNENAYIVTMYDGVSGPMDCIQVPLVDIFWGGASGLPVPEVATLGNVTPNPFTDEVAVSLNLPTATVVDARVYNVKGELVQTVFSGRMDRGEHQLVFDGRDASAGIYFCRVDACGKAMWKKMILVRRRRIVT